MNQERAAVCEWKGSVKVNQMRFIRNPMFLKSDGIIHKLQIFKAPSEEIFHHLKSALTGITCKTNPYPPVRFIDFYRRTLVVLKTSRWCKPTDCSYCK